MLKRGDAAPDFDLASQDGGRVRLADLRGKKNVVLFFYPKDNTMVCTKEACSFRDSYAEFASRDTVVIGISSDSAESHKGFAAKHALPFPLLADESGAVRRAYGIRRTFGIIPGRATFVIDKRGVIQAAFAAQFQAEQHVREALAALR